MWNKLQQDLKKNTNKFTARFLQTSRTVTYANTFFLL